MIEWNASPVPIEKSSRNTYDLQTFEIRADFVTILTNQRNI